MKAKELIGQKVTRTAPCAIASCKDRSYMGSILIILNANDDLIAYTQEDGMFKDKVYTLSAEWCDDNWVSVEEFLNVANENLEKLHKETEV